MAVYFIGVYTYWLRAEEWCARTSASLKLAHVAAWTVLERHWCGGVVRAKLEGHAEVDAAGVEGRRRAESGDVVIEEDFW